MKRSKLTPEWVPPDDLLDLPPAPDWAGSGSDVSIADVGRLHTVSARSIAAWRRMGDATGRSLDGRVPFVEGYHYYWKIRGSKIRYHRERFEMWCTEPPQEHLDRIKAWTKAREVLSA